MVINKEGLGKQVDYHVASRKQSAPIVRNDEIARKHGSAKQKKTKRDPINKGLKKPPPLPQAFKPSQSREQLSSSDEDRSELETCSSDETAKRSKTKQKRSYVSFQLLREKPPLHQAPKPSRIKEQLSDSDTYENCSSDDDDYKSSDYKWIYK